MLSSDHNQYILFYNIIGENEKKIGLLFLVWLNYRY